jgi:hypothetical protein
VTYATGIQWLYGRTGIASVQVGDTAIDQKIGLAFKGHWAFPGAGSFGLSFPSAGSYVWEGLDPSNDNSATLLPYSTWLFTAISQEKFLPVFSHAFDLKSASHFGTLAFGGLPDVQHSGQWASTPIQKASPDDARAFPTKEHLKNVPYPDYYQYKINLDGWTINGVPFSDTPDGAAVRGYIIDSGSEGIDVPMNLYNATAVAYDPPGVWTGYDWKLDCNATAPDLDLIIDGISFPVGKNFPIYQSDDG